MKGKIAITVTSFGRHDSTGLDILGKNSFEVIGNLLNRKLNKSEVFELCAGCIGIIAGTEIYDNDLLERLSGLKVISRCGAGVDNIDIEAAKKLGIKIFNTPDAPTLAVAELTIGLIFALLRKIPLMDREVRAGIWRKNTGNLLAGKSVGIVGFGRIGKKVAAHLKALGADVCYFDPFVTEEGTAFHKVELKELLRRSDIISLHLPYTAKNHNIFGKEEFSAMKHGAFLVNCARGGIVDEGALYLAVKDGKLAGAATDVFEEEPYKGPLRELDDVILTPHVGSYAKEARIKMEIEAVENLIKGLEGV